MKGEPQLLRQTHVIGGTTRGPDRPSRKKPSPLAIAVTLTLIQGLRVFDQVMALTGGGPDNATQTLATEIYQQTFTFQEFGFGAAMALILTVFILVCAIGQLALTRDRT